ncbi:tRNA epoxyqueuosine(34) reductase QueG [Rubeoparvulum massiliense]|uniref:tRNA epoxyqueuosine(34) reductase QueG n=1 Tax=Rubeoparvulum massiliense TaxID=1631346 RepID=UPI0009E374F0|nr:tRNA epoxyqueuosine(34) reductase QueG [Rubeoparvulum massiliense]
MTDSNISIAFSHGELLELKQELIAYAHQIGIDKIGFATVEPFDDLLPILQRRQEAGHASSFEEQDISLRIDPQRILPGAASLIAIALAYPSRIGETPHGSKEGYRGMICRAAWGVDYHQVLRAKLEEIEAFLKARVPQVKITGMVDTGALVDRAVAERAGIGWIGKNCSLITPEFGSWVYLGELITTIPFPPDSPMENGCGTCTRCLEACPTQAFLGPHQLNAKRCLSQITQEKNWIHEEFRLKLGNRLYGCDTCQQVCPYNRKKDFHLHPEMEPVGELVKPLLKPFISLGKREFTEIYGKTAAAWRGKKPLQRNAIIALAHYGDRTAAPLLTKILRQDPRPPIRGIAAWSLYEIFGDECRPILEESLALEKDPDVREEILQCLAKCVQK